MARVLVTGGAGFIGSHLCEKLIDSGHHVVAIDNFRVGRLSNLKDIESKDFEVYEIDITDGESLSALFSRREFDLVFHLAALADIVPSIQNPVDYFETNVNGTLKILELCRDRKIRKFVYAASSSCYGIPNVYPTPETAEIKPEYPYALTKYLGEELVLHWGKVYNLPVISLRLFNVYGPRARTSGTYGAVFGVFLAQKLAGKPFTIVGDGNQTRDFTYVSDVAEAFISASNSNITGEIFNVGSGGSYSINELVDMLGGDRIHIPKRPGEPDCTFAEISKIRKDLSWGPRVTFRSGVKTLLSDLSEWSSSPVWTPESIGIQTEAWFKFLSKKGLN